MNKIIAISMGCPAGIGPEISLKLFESGLSSGVRAVVVGDLSVLARAADELGLAPDLVAWQPGEEISPGTVPVLSLSELAEDLTWGRPDAACGHAAGLYIEKAAELALNGRACAMVTCPVAKEFLNQGGFAFPGHTEMLAEICKCEEFGMMMAGDRLRVTLATIHMSLKDVVACLSSDKVARMIFLTHASLRRDFAIGAPRLAVAGLNPHAGESGMFGDEEERVIRPAVDEARAQGLDVSDPLPPDTVFARAAAGDYDAVVAMYHDQGLIPFKLLHFADGVNFTMGLPLVRTSVDHGTAYDIAGRGIASARSLEAAVEMAAMIAGNRDQPAGTAHGSD